MRAVVAPRPGPPEVLEVVATTFVDTQLRAGRGPRPVDASEFPLVPGNGVAGTVAVVGEGVDGSWLGAAVVTSTGGRGGYLPHGAASGRWGTVDADEAAAAHAAMEARSTIGKTLLVTDEFARRRSSTRSEDMETSP